MTFLILAILLNAYIIVVFKIFERFGVDNLQAIVANYWVCAATGSVFIGRFPVSAHSPGYPWFYWALLMGASFISVFNLIAYSTVREGITTTTIANKLSLAIPVAFALWLYGESMSWMKGLGILLAVPAVYLSAQRNGNKQRIRGLWLAIVLFMASGLLDTLVNFVAMQFFSTDHAEVDRRAQSIYLIHAFFTAGCIGLVIVGFLLATGRRRFAWKNLIAGLALGVPNFFSIYFLLRLLQTKFLPGSAAIPINNIGIVLVATLTAILFFKEKAGWQRIVGMLLSIAAILLIMLSELHA
jgi:drug/metabolite transporter (DMT)-like permease